MFNSTLIHVSSFFSSQEIDLDNVPSPLIMEEKYDLNIQYYMTPSV